MSNINDVAVRFCTASVVASAMQISIRQFYRLKKQWSRDRLIKEGKHFIRPGTRAIRYDLDAMLQLARARGYC